MNVNVLPYVEKILGASSGNLCGVSVLASTAISVDRLLALLLGLRYIQTCRSIKASSGSHYLLLANCCFNWMHLGVESWYCRYSKLCCHNTLQAQVQNNVPLRQQNGERIPLNIARYKKTVSSIMWVQLALVACYAPWVILPVLYVNGIEHDVGWLATTTLIYFNSSLNPILYCWKIREVKQAVKGTIRQLYCFWKL